VRQRSSRRGGAAHRGLSLVREDAGLDAKGVQWGHLAPRFYALLNRRFSGSGPNLQPVATLQARVHRIPALHHHTFEIQCFDSLEECLAFADNVVGKPDAASVVFRQDVFQERLAFDHCKQ
jgi:hypothetical protein